MSLVSRGGRHAQPRYPDVPTPREVLVFRLETVMPTKDNLMSALFESSVHAHAKLPKTTVSKTIIIAEQSLYLHPPH
jgi:hypothetical protein